ncbi:MAG: hypothetical protein LBR66_00670 [Candidatus Symbiothrix sp.]|jgi:hypothetical protein|nr:hypothetical protein [Candidatus Symbiothrix sp.]
MNPLKSILAACALFVCTCISAQESQPTKEATTEWLQEKLLEYSSFNHIKSFKIEIGECDIVLSGYENSTDVIKSIFPTNFKKMERSEDKESFHYGKYVLKYDYKAYQTIFKGKIQPYSTGWHFLVETTPPEMAARIEKAIRHLATFCSKYKKSEDEPF